MKQISETIDGSIKNAIQLKTLDGSLEWSQMFDALNDCPAEFQNKLVGALNSIAETKDVPATQVFKLVLCGNSDEDVCKKLYNWWRGLFDILSRCKIPEERVGEYNDKVDALMAEITKAGNDLEMNEEPAVVTEGGEELGYEQADKEDEEEMLQNMEFAIQHIGEIANKVKELVNFVNPYCGTEVNESMDKPVRYNVGDKVLYKGEEYVVTTIDEFELPDEELYGISRESENVPGLSFNEWAIAEELEPVSEKFTEEDKSIMKNMNERGGDSEWVSMDSLIGVKESDEWSGGFKVGDKVNWIDPETEEETSGWTVISAPDEEDAKELSPEDAIYTIENDDGSEAEVLGSELRPAKMVNEAQVVVDANDVWDILELLDDDVANKNLTDLINSHVRTEEEIMDAIENILGAAGYSDNVSKAALNGMFSSDNIHELIGELGLDVDAYMDRGVIQDANKPTSVELESNQKFNVGDEITWRHHNGSLSNEVVRELIDGGYIVDDGFAGEKECYPGHVPEELLGKPNMEWDGNEWKQGIGMNEATKKVSLYVDWDDDGAGLDNNVVIDVPAEIADSEESDALYDYISDWIDHQDFCVNDWMITDIEGLMDEGSEEVKKPEEVKSQDKTFNADGENKTLVAGEERKPVCEMTIEQEVDNPWNLAEMLWGQGKENFEELLRSGVVDEDYVMQMLEEMELRNLTNINDAFAYDFESMLDTFGCDPKAWSQHLKIVKKDDSVDDDDE